MRTPQRKFVVEFKSGRRQSKAPGSSIWGDTDLSALARAVKEETPALFSEIPEPVTDETVIQQVSDVVSPVATHTPEESGSCEEVVPPIKEDGHDGPTFAKAAAVPKTIARPAGAGIERPPKPQISSRNVTSRTHVAPVPAVGEVIASLDEIAALEAENAFLRRLRIKQLLEENARLKQMLDRRAGWDV